ncbi:MAG: cyclic nucleotide-binding domain-containing protein [Myxococcota bacterium]
MRLTVGTSTHVGRREMNQDAHLALPEAGIFAVADGMGGLDAGEVAAAEAVAHVHAAIDALGPARERVARGGGPADKLALLDALEQAFVAAAGAVHARAASRDQRMGATLTAGVIAGDALFFAHVGDTRLYVARDGRARLVTEDHSVAARLVREGRMTAEEAVASPRRHELYETIGALPDVRPDLAELALVDGDTLVFCSDGVWDTLADEELGAAVHGLSAQAAADRLVFEAWQRGSEDNLTAVVVQVHGDRDGEIDVVDLEAYAAVSPVLGALDDAERRRILPYLHARAYAAGEVVFREGEAGWSFFVVAEGEVEVRARGRTLTRLGVGQHFGEIALVRPSGRTATVVATRATRLVSIDRADFESLVTRRPDLGARVLRELLRAMAERLADLTERVSGG